MDRMIKQASDQAEKTPTDASAWAMLAHTYEMQGRFAESVKAYAKLVALAPKDAQVLADYADALAVANGRSFKGEPMALVQRALSLDAKNVKALALAGTAYLEAKQADHALKAWESVRAISRDPAMLELADAGTIQAKALAGGAAPTVPPAASGPAPAPGEGRVTGRVSLAPGVLAKIPPTAVVFIYARPADGARMPVALLKKKASDLPMDFVLDDTNAMVQGMELSRLKQVVLVARISASGNVTPAPGDWQAVTAPVAVGQKDIKLEISELLK
jgi:cytochrome c-type biogenesis protein CcmH